MNEQNLLQLTEKYHSTGIIDDGLISYFTQNGRWVGDKIGWTYSTYVTALNRMKRAYLPHGRRTSRCRAGTRLLTSFVWRDPSSVYLPYIDVIGSVFVPARAVIRAPWLRTVGIHFVTHTNHSITLPSLVRVDGNFETIQSCNLDAPSLRSIGGNCRVFGNSPPSLEEVGGGYSVMWSFCFSSPTLEVVGGTLDLHKSNHVDLPKIRLIGRSLVASDQAKVIRIPALETVGGDLFASGAELISARSLRSVGGRIDSTSAKDFWNPNIACGGEWFMYSDDVKRWEQRKRVRIALKGENDPLFI
jgi:hypothetical protein